jgi:SAM-dependent methyltransferase
VKLNIGCGDKLLDGYVNIDLFNPKADKICDGSVLDWVKDDTVDEVLAIAVFEHISPYKSGPTLREWWRVLKKGGLLILEVPDILETCKNFEKADKAERYKLINCMFGSAEWSLRNPHLFGWYDDILKDHLWGAGFRKIRKKEPQGGHWGYMLRMEAEK